MEEYRTWRWNKFKTLFMSLRYATVLPNELSLHITTDVLLLYFSKEIELLVDNSDRRYFCILHTRVAICPINGLRSMINQLSPNIEFVSLRWEIGYDHHVSFKKTIKDMNDDKQFIECMEEVSNRFIYCYLNM
jgi:hypothetical protein